ncbi:hypothetical protein [Bacillus sp. BHET2]|uniref:hypothetical protein n=1 Tax=Bacillus sp. BHET2 TaxID=2583818 RepID=UPI001485EAD2|nr:hypothetical protein [Bacillus sp. BHET2]
MKVIQLFVQMKCTWHSLRIHYNRVLLEGCLDCQIKKKLQEKIEYHEMKLNSSN